MVVYRVEHETNKLGPYHNGITSWEHYGIDCPSPDDDGIEACGSNLYYGFESKRLAYEWFGAEYIEEFTEKDHYLYLFVVRDEAVFKGEKHLAFDKRQSVRAMKCSLGILP